MHLGPKHFTQLQSSINFFPYMKLAPFTGCLFFCVLSVYISLPLSTPDTLHCSVPLQCFVYCLNRFGVVEADGCVLLESHPQEQPTHRHTPLRRQGQLDWFISMLFPSFVITVIFLCLYHNQLPHRLVDNSSLSTLTGLNCVSVMQMHWVY